MLGLDMMGTYDSRKVGRYETDGLTISTCSVTDSIEPYETAVSHRLYNNGSWVIVEKYSNEDAAKTGHDEWVAKMTADELPDQLLDRSDNFLGDMMDAVNSDESWRVFKKGGDSEK